MDTANLQAFIKVAETGSFSMAARQLFITQPAVSKRISQLEQQLGSQLLDRSGKRILLTQTGRLLESHARRILNDIQALRQQIADMEGNPMGSLGLATSHHIGLHRLPPILRSYSSRYPDVELDLSFMDSEQACLLVENNELEMAVVTLPFATSSKLSFTPVWHDELKIVCATGHPLARRQAPRLEHLVQHAAVLPSHGTYTREAIENALQSVLPETKITLETNYLETIKMMVSVGLGWSVLPMSMLDDSLQVIEIGAFSASRELGIVLNRQRSTSRAAQAMIDLIRANSST
jgi:DNA-binding transcriptional LysR family regulator